MNDDKHASYESRAEAASSPVLCQSCGRLARRRRVLFFRAIIVCTHLTSASQDASTSLSLPHHSFPYAAGVARKATDDMRSPQSSKLDMDC
jgi:hypothetical protein